MPIRDQTLIDAYSTVEAINFDQLARPDLGQHLNFENGAQRLRMLRDDAFLIRDRYDDLRMSSEAGTRLTQSLNQLNEVAQHILSLDVNENPAARRQQIINEIVSLENRFQEQVTPLVTQAKLAEVNAQLQTRGAADLKDQLAEEIKAVRQAKQDAEKMVRDLRNLSAHGGTEVSSTVFLEEANDHERLAERWLWATVVTVILTAVLVFAIFYGWWPFNRFAIDQLADKNYYQLAHAFTFKLILVSLAYFALYQCLKNYHIHRNLAVSNRHRHSTLQVYQVMTNAAEPEGRQTILQEAAKAIFEPVISGYLNADGPAPINLVEIANKVAPKS